jgi:hypothetical protein
MLWIPCSDNRFSMGVNLIITLRLNGRLQAGELLNALEVCRAS